MNSSDTLWLEEAKRNGWVMPAQPFWKRLWGVRHVRFFYLGMQAARYRQMTAAMGLGVGGLPQFDTWMLYGIRRGFEPAKKRGPL